MKNIKLVNIEILESIHSGKDVKILLDSNRICFSYLNMEHSELEKSVFGLNGDLIKTVPGYIKPHSNLIELRTSKLFNESKIIVFFKTLQKKEELFLLDGYDVRYGGKLLHKFTHNYNSLENNKIS